MQVLRAVNEVLLREDGEDTLCTVVYVLAEREDGRIRLRSAAAGHPLPLTVRQAGGPVETLGEPGTLLGTVPVVDLAEGTAELGPGDALVLYTDGVTEARFGTGDRRVELFGDARLRAVLVAVRGGHAAAVAARIETAVLDF